MTTEPTDILIIDDDPDLGMMVQSILKYAGYKVKHISVADNITGVLELTNPQVILMDMLLSGMDGRDICRQLKNNDDTKKIKIVMMSAHPDADITCRQAGADDFIGKPFDIDLFLTTMKRAIATVG